VSFKTEKRVNNRHLPVSKRGGNGIQNDKRITQDLQDCVFCQNLLFLQYEFTFLLYSHNSFFLICMDNQ